MNVSLDHPGRLHAFLARISYFLLPFRPPVCSRGASLVCGLNHGRPSPRAPAQPVRTGRDGFCLFDTCFAFPFHLHSFSIFPDAPEEPLSFTASPMAGRARELRRAPMRIGRSSFRFILHLHCIIVFSLSSPLSTMSHNRASRVPDLCHGRRTCRTPAMGKWRWGRRLTHLQHCFIARSV